jgi:WD40 repeat protein
MKTKLLIYALLLSVIATACVNDENRPVFTQTETRPVFTTIPPTSTPTKTITPTITNTNTPEATETLTPTSTKTLKPTATFTPTTSPWPTPTLLATRVTTDTATIVEEFEGYAISLIWSIDGKYLYIGTKENGLIAYDVKKDKLGPNVGNNSQVQALAISPNGKILAVGLANDGSIRLLSTETGMLEQTIWPAHNDWPQSIVFGINSDWLVSSGDDGRILLWDVNNGELIHTISDESTSLGMGLSPDGKSLIAGCGYEEVVKIWDTETWTIKSTFIGDQAQDLAISPDGKRIVTAGGGIHEANVWDVNSGNQVFNLREHPSWVWAVAYSPKGNLIASAGLGESVYLWDAETGIPVRELYTGPDFIQTLAFSSDGNWLASGGSQVILWDVSKY